MQRSSRFDLLLNNRNFARKMTQPEAALPLPADVLVAIAARLATRDVFSLVFCCRITRALAGEMLAHRSLACGTPTADLAPGALRRCLQLLGRRPWQVEDPQMLVTSADSLAVLREWGLKPANVLERPCMIRSPYLVYNIGWMTGFREPVPSIV